MNRKQLVLTGILCCVIPFNYLVYTQWTRFKHTAPLHIKAQNGRMVWQKYNCTSCHQLYGLGGYMGPDLTNVISGKGVDYTRALISSGGGKMPALGVSASETDALLAFLSAVDSTGIYPLKNHSFTWFGTVITPNE